MNRALIAQDDAALVARPDGAYRPSVDTSIAMWLQSVGSKGSNSARTATAYRETLSAYRALMLGAGVDLDDEAHEAEMAHAASIFAARSTREGVAITSKATRAQRLAILSSYFTFMVKRGYRQHNPILMLDRPTAQAYATATPLQDVNLSAIDRSTLAGKRDYALLLVLLTTGRRASEIARITRADLDISDRAITVTTHCKGGKVMHDRLARGTAAALHEWMQAAYPDGMRGDDPIFISLSPHGRGQRLTLCSLSRICEKWLGVSKVHATRHTFATTMERAGASLTDIQDRLGHANAATTGRYMHALHDAENRYADTLESLYGIGD